MLLPPPQFQVLYTFHENYRIDIIKNIEPPAYKHSNDIWVPFQAILYNSIIFIKIRIVCMSENSIASTRAGQNQ